MTPEERFSLKIRVDVESGCWIWTGTLTNGYGRFRVGRQAVRAHRWAYREWVGELLPGHEVDHECHNRDHSCVGGVTCHHRRCVNPAHLDQVVRRVNLHRSINTVNSRHSAQTHCKHGHEFTPENTIIEMRTSGPTRHCRECARRRSRESKARRATFRGEPVLASLAN